MPSGDVYIINPPKEPSWISTASECRLNLAVGAQRSDSAHCSAKSCWPP